MEILSPHTTILQTVQNSMIRVILGLNQAHHVKMLSVNQMLVYHTVMEAYNITNKKASDQLQNKFMHEGKHLERSAANNEMYVCTRKNPKTVYRFLLYWTQTI